MGESFGRYLRREREMREVTLEQIANETKIKIGLLRAIEADRVAELPSPAIVKGFLRSYARILGLAPHDLQLRYQSYLEEAAPERLTQALPRPWVPARRRRLHPVGWFIIAVIGIGLALRFSGGEASRAPEKAPKPRRPEAVVYRKNYLQELQTPSPAGSPPYVAAASPEWSGPPEGGASIVLRAIAPTSVALSLDGGEPRPITLAPGQPVVRHAFKSAEIDRIDPALLTLEVNGEPFSPETPLDNPARVALRVLPPEPVEEGEPPGPSRVTIETGAASDEPLPPPAPLPRLEFPKGAARAAGGGPADAAARTPKRVEAPAPIFAPSRQSPAPPASETASPPAPRAPEAAPRPAPAAAPRPEAKPEPPPEPAPDRVPSDEPDPVLVPKAIPLPSAPPAPHPSDSGDPVR